MSKVRIEAYLDLATFYKLNQVREANEAKGYSHVLNTILKKFFKSIDSQDQAVDSLNKIIQRYVTEINELKAKLKERELHEVGQDTL